MEIELKRTSHKQIDKFKAEFETLLKERNLELYPLTGDDLRGFASDRGIGFSTVSAWKTRLLSKGTLARRNQGHKVTGSTRQVAPVETSVTWDQIKDAVILAFEQAAKADEWEDRCRMLENQLAALRNQVSVAARAEETKAEESRRFRLATQQGTLKSRLFGNKG